jgi:hypothetical protein
VGLLDREIAELIRRRSTDSTAWIAKGPARASPSRRAHRPGRRTQRRRRAGEGNVIWLSTPTSSHPEGARVLRMRSSDRGGGRVRTYDEFPAAVNSVAVQEPAHYHHARGRARIFFTPDAAPSRR